MHDIGDLLKFGITVRDANGALANSSPVTAVAQWPVENEQTLTVTNPGTGLYETTFTPTAAGMHRVVWTVGGAYPGSHVEDFYVAAAAGAIVGLAEAKAHLNIPAGYTDDDEEIRGLLQTVSDAADLVTGQAWAQRAVTHVASGGTPAVALPVLPVADADGYPALLLVTESGATLPATAYDDAGNGLLTRLAGPYTAGCWAAGHRNVEVTYVAGRAVIPPTIRQGALELLRHLWDTQRGTMGPARPGPADETYVPGLSFSLPRRVVELWELHRAPGGFA